jgi:hypothetical protein
MAYVLKIVVDVPLVPIYFQLSSIFFASVKAARRNYHYIIHCGVRIVTRL